MFVDEFNRGDFSENGNRTGCSHLLSSTLVSVADFAEVKSFLFFVVMTDCFLFVSACADFSPKFVLLDFSFCPVFCYQLIM